MLSTSSFAAPCRTAIAAAAAAEIQLPSVQSTASCTPQLRTAVVLEPRVDEEVHAKPVLGFDPAKSQMCKCASAKMTMSCTFP